MAYERKIDLLFKIIGFLRNVPFTIQYERLSQAEHSGHFGIRCEVFSPAKNLKLWGPQNSGPYLYHTVEIHCEHMLIFF